MVQVEWGTKRSCPSCAGRFYDLGKNPAVCPKCRYQYDPTVQTRPRRGRASKKAAGEEVSAQDMKRKAAEARKKKAAPDEFEAIETIEGMEDIEEIEEIDDDIENLEEIGEIDDMEEPASEDDGDDEAIIEELDPQENSLIDTIEDEDEDEEDKND